MDRDGNRSRPSAQKGVLLVFTALLLPVVFACAGLAVDLGNMYVHKSNLQNAVDSAALAAQLAISQVEKQQKTIPEQT